MVIKQTHELLLSGGELCRLMKSVLDSGGLFSFQAGGTSMWPGIKDRDKVVLCPFRSGTIHIGDIVAFTHPVSGGALVHRVIKTRHEMLLIKGDNCSAHDGWIGIGSVFGTVHTVLRNESPVIVGVTKYKKIVAILSRYYLLRPMIRLFRLFIRRITLKQSETVGHHSAY